MAAHNGSNVEDVPKAPNAPSGCVYSSHQCCIELGCRCHFNAPSGRVYSAYQCCLCTMFVLSHGVLIVSVFLDSDGPLPKMPQCTICDTSVGETPREAALHFRSREHLNKRLQRGLPVAAVAVQPAAGADTNQRNHINQFLRQGLSQKGWNELCLSGLVACWPLPNWVQILTSRQ
jgi:hypothetical protein